MAAQGLLKGFRFIKVQLQDISVLFEFGPVCIGTRQDTILVLF